jgi:O-antigen/teichoic acid export membrane protein
MPSRTLVRGIVASVFSKGLAAIVPVITVPWALHALGDVGYGTWATALSLTAMAAFADLGLGAGLMTALPKAIAANDQVTARKHVSTAYALLGGVSLLSLIGIWLLNPMVDWAAAVNGSEIDQGGQVELIVVVTLSGFCLNIVASAIARIQQAAQQVALSNVWLGTGSLVSLSLLFLATRLNLLGSSYVAVAAFAPVLVSGVNTAVFFSSKTGRFLRPSPRHASRESARILLRFGMRFLVLHALMSVSFSSDAWIVSHATSLSEVPRYSIPAKIFSVIGTATNILTMPFWPTASHAMASGNVSWVRATTRRLTIVTPLLVGVLSVAAVAIGPALIEWWLDGRIPVSVTLLVGFAILAIMQAVCSPMMMVQNAKGILRPQAIAYVGLLAVVPIKLYVARHLGIEWMPYVTAAGYAALLLPASVIAYRLSLRSIKSGQEGY